MVHLAANVGNGSILAGIVSVPILYNIKEEVSYIENTIIQYQLSTNQLLCLTTFITYTMAYLIVIYNSHIAKMITPSNYKKSYTKVYELLSYFISTIHAIILCICGLYYCINYQKIDTDIIDMIFSASIGYYISDIIYLFVTCEKDYKSIITFVTHHIMTISALLYHSNINNIIYKNTATYIGARLYLSEFSVIPLNYIWYLKNTDDNYKLNINYITAFEAVFRLFFVFRIINYSDLIRILIEKDYIYNPMSITIIILTILNYVWFYKIYKSARIF